jgi:putative NADH-flavin reductase
MKIGVIAASGKAGSLIVDEALNRGNEVVGIVRNASKVSQDIKVIEKDIFDLRKSDLEEFDVLINAFGSKGSDPIVYQTSTRHLIDLLENTSIRLIVVGGAGSLYTDESRTMQVYQTPEFPAVVYPTSSNLAKALDLLKNSKLNWTFFAPAITFDYKGSRSGAYLLGTDYVILNNHGESYISYLDYVNALLDEVDNKKYHKQVMTAVSEKKA